jgi:hypothetical protein
MYVTMGYTVIIDMTDCEKLRIVLQPNDANSIHKNNNKAYQ